MPDTPGRKPKTHYVDPQHYDPYSDDTLEMGETDSKGNQHPDHAEYEREMERRYVGKDKPQVDHHDELNELDDLGTVPF